MANSQAIKQEDSTVELRVLALAARFKEGEVPEITMSTNYFNAVFWKQILDRLQLEWERQRIREEERIRLQEEEDK